MEQLLCEFSFSYCSISSMYWNVSWIILLLLMKNLTIDLSWYKYRVCCNCFAWAFLKGITCMNSSSLFFLTLYQIKLLGWVESWLWLPVDNFCSIYNFFFWQEDSPCLVSLSFFVCIFSLFFHLYKETQPIYLSVYSWIWSLGFSLFLRLLQLMPFVFFSY